MKTQIMLNKAKSSPSITEKTEPAILLNPAVLTDDEDKFVQNFGKRVIGQPEALELAQMAYDAINNPFRDKNRPAGIYFLVGPSRTGKSLTAKTLALLLHGNQDALTRLQGGDYLEYAQVLDLKGAPPMYTGYKDPTEMDKLELKEDDIDPTSVISSHNLKRARMDSSTEVDIIVIDEFEKATYEFFKLWMGVFDTGFLRLGNGQEVDFSNTIFILTSNLAMHELEKMAKDPIGFSATKPQITKSDVASVVSKALARTYPPEFRNRIDAVVLFQPLDGVAVRRVVDREVAIIQERIDTELGKAKAFELRLTDAAKAHVLARSEAIGKSSVAEVKRVLNNEISTPLSREYRKGTIAGGDCVVIDLLNSSLSFSVIENGRSSQTGAIDSSFGNRLLRAKQINDLMVGEGRPQYRYFVVLSGGQPENTGKSLASELETTFGVTIERTITDRTSHSFRIEFSSRGEIVDLIQEKYPNHQIKQAQ